MRLKYLELYGFKSFAEKTRLNFNDNFACIVGPNGSGKSNIADAIRWVLGEQSAKELRGAKMEDVIFSGAQGRRPMNMAQVTLGLDNSDGSLGLSYDELTVSRKVYRSGESEYLINKVPVRRRDIRELFMDTGIGREGYSLIGQGKIDELLSSRGEDRRAVFDEASGIAKYKYKKEESLRRLEKTEKNLSEVEVEVRGKEQEEKILKRQAEDARTGLKLTQDLEVHELSLLKSKVDQAEKEVLKYQAEKEKLEGEGEGLRKGLEGLMADLQPDQEALSAYHENQKQLENQVRILKEKIQKIQSETRLKEEQLHFYRRDRERLQDLIQKKKDQARDLLNSEADSKSKIEALKNKKTLFQNNLRIFLEEDEKKEENLSAQLEEGQKKKEKIREKLSFLDFEERRREEEAQSLSHLQEKKKEEMEILVEKMAGLQKEADENKKRHSELENEEKAGKENLQAILQKEKTLEENLRQWDQETFEREKKLAQVSSHLSLLQSLIDHYEGYSKAVQDLLRLSTKDSEISSRMLGTLASQIEALTPYENAMDAALGGALQNIVVPSQKDGQFLIETLKKKNIGRVTFLPMDKIQGKAPVSYSDPRILCQGVDALTYDPRLRPMIEHFLSNTVIVKNLSDAISLSKKVRGIRILTLDGEVINSWGSMVGGKLRHQNEASLINRQSQAKNLAREAKKLEEEKKAALIQKTAIEEKREKEARSFESQSQEIENQRRALEELKARELGLSSDMKILEGEIQKVRDFLQEETPYSKEEFQEKRTALEKEQQEADEAYRSLQKDWQDAQKRHIEEEKESALLKEKLEVLARDLGLAENQYNDLLEKKAASQEESKERQKDLEDLEKQIRENEAFLEESQRSINKWEGELERALDQEKNDRLDGGKLQKKVEDALREKERLEDERAENEKNIFENRIHLDQWQVKAKDFKEDYCSAYDLPMEALEIKLKNLAPVKTTKTKVYEIKKALSQIGYFNYQSIEEYERLSQDLEFLQRQVEDLKKSRKDILLLIQDLNRTMIRLFEESFKAINQSFNEVFSILFDGGGARLELDRPDILEANIDIVAQPPHKKLQSLELLSGGERSMTALALLFAIFSIHPTPFCVLDEIDAALDEANTGRYGHFLLTLTEKTQFVIITHRKSTMELADVLYGVTMDKGISQIISLKFEDYPQSFKEEIEDGLL